MCEGHGESEMAEFLDLVLVKSHLNFLIFFFLCRHLFVLLLNKKKQLLACHFWQEPFPLKKYYEVVSVKAFGGKLTLPSPLILLIKYQYFN